jgi:hypothetical protein
LEVGKDYVTKNECKAHIAAVFPEIKGGPSCEYPFVGWVSFGMSAQTACWTEDGLVRKGYMGLGTNIKGLWVEPQIKPAPPVINWSAMPEWLNAAVQWSSGTWEAFDIPPVQHTYSTGSKWWDTTKTRLRCTIPAEYAPKDYKGQWQDSLVVRPFPKPQEWTFHPYCILLTLTSIA